MNDDKPVAYYVQDIYPIIPTIGRQVICKIVGHPRQDEFESTCQITSRVVYVSPCGEEFATLNTYYKPFKGNL